MSTQFHRAAAVLGVLAFGLNGCATIISGPANSCGPALSDADITDSVKTYLANINWKDPDSVQIRNVEVRGCQLVPHGRLVKEPIPPAGWQIDFEVNAHNSYGGYTGYQFKSLIRTSDGKIHWDPET